MIAPDTNVLLRRLLNDDPAQAEKARRLFAQADQILITDVVLCETIWTLKGKRYQASRDDIAALVLALLEEPKVVFESQATVWSALNEFIDAPIVQTANGVHRADLADALIVAKAKTLMAQWSQPYDMTYTFDLAVQALAGTRAP